MPDTLTAYVRLRDSVRKTLLEGQRLIERQKIETYWEDKQRFKAYELVNIIKETLDFMTKGNEHFDVW